MLFRLAQRQTCDVAEYRQLTALCYSVPSPDSAHPGVGRRLLNLNTDELATYLP
jgi:hypothetical protein